MFEHIIGNEPAKRYLTHTARKGTTGNSLLFAGPEGIGKSLFAEAFAALLLCQNDPQQRQRQKIEAGAHPDLHVYRPEGKIGLHSIAAMREFSEQVYLAPAEAPWKIFIIHEAHRMLSYSANALLKTFEEPAENALIILLSSSPSSLLPTVLSRCRCIHFHALTNHEVCSYLTGRYSKTLEEAQAIAALAHGSIGRAVQLIKEGGNPARKLLLDFLSTGNSDYRAICAAASSIAEQIETAKATEEEKARKTILQGAGEHLSAAQKQSFEKEVEGAAALYGLHEMQQLFYVLFSWYRDMHLLYLNGNRAYLLNPDYQKPCSQALEKGKLLPLETIAASIDKAHLALERSVSYQICLEGLLLGALGGVAP